MAARYGDNVSTLVYCSTVLLVAYFGIHMNRCVMLAGKHFPVLFSLEAAAAAESVLDALFSLRPSSWSSSRLVHFSRHYY